MNTFGSRLGGGKKEGVTKTCSLNLCTVQWFLSTSVAVDREMGLPSDLSNVVEVMTAIKFNNDKTVHNQRLP